MSDSHAADVQAELQQYLNSKNINALFISIVESLLIEKPANPIAYMIEYLNKQFPDQAKPALEALTGGMKPAGAPVNSGPKPVTKDNTKAKEVDSDEDDDDVADIPTPVVVAAKPKSRRVSVSAESTDPAKLKALKPVEIPKDETVTKNLLTVVSKSPLLRALDQDQKDMIVKAFSGPITKEDGDNIIVQGEIGDVFYLLEEGSVDVYVKKGGEDVKVHAYKPGDAFGELAIMYNAPRAATCRANCTSKLWALDRVSFKAIVVAAAMQKRETYRSFLKKVPILESLTEMEIMTLADSLAEEKFVGGEVICNQGDEGNYFYIVKEGVAVCSQVDATGKKNEVAKLQSGTYFGEIALLTSKPRQATVTAEGALTCLSIDRATFIRVLGSMDEIMKRNMEAYNKFNAANI